MRPICLSLVCGAVRPFMKELPKIRKEDRCGYCHTCLNPHLKKPCKTRRDEVRMVAVVCLALVVLYDVRLPPGGLSESNSVSAFGHQHIQDVVCGLSHCCVLLTLHVIPV